MAAKHQSRKIYQLDIEKVRNAILGGYVKEYTQEFYRKYGGEGKW